MRAQNSNDVFYITLSKWKVWTYTIFCWAIACFPLFATLLFVGELFTDEPGSTSDTIIFITILGTIFLIPAAIPFIFLTKLNRPMATLTRSGFSGMKNLKKQNFAWAPNTVITSGNKNIILANLDATQSRASKLLGGPKAAVIIHHFFAKQKYQDVMEAINRLSPYHIKRITMWEAAKH